MVTNDSPDTPRRFRRFERLGREVGPLIALFVLAALVLCFGWIASEVTEGDTKHFDVAILTAFRTPGDLSDLLGPPWFEEMVRDVTSLGSYAFIILLLVAAVGFLLLVHKHALALALTAAELGGMLTSTLLKNLFHRARPDLEHATRVFTASFPSGHATLSAVTFLTLGALLTRTNADHRVKVYFMAVAVFLTFIVGVSRVYLGVHYPSDVLAGWCVGSAWALLCWVLVLKLQRQGQVEAAGGGKT